MGLLFLSVGAATLLILVVLGVSLFRQLRALSGALREFSAAVTPVLDEIQREGERAAALGETLARRQAELSREGDSLGRPRRGRR